MFTIIKERWSFCYTLRHDGADCGLHIVQLNETVTV